MMALSRALSIALLLSLLFISPSFSATFSTSEDSNKGTIDLKNGECPDDTDPLSPSDGVQTTFSPDIDFQDPAITSTVIFETENDANFPFQMEIRYMCATEDGNGCSEPDINMTFNKKEDLDDFIYDAIILPGSCPQLQGANISCTVSFCSLTTTNVKFTANMTSLAQETLFEDDKTIPLPGPQVMIVEGETTDVVQLFTFDLSKDKGTFTLSLDDDKPINDWFASLGVNGEDPESLEDVDSSSYSVTVKDKVNYFSLLEANTTADVPGNVKFTQKSVKDDDHFWLWVGVAAGVALIVVIVASVLVYCCCCKGPADYEEVA